MKFRKSVKKENGEMQQKQKKLKNAALGWNSVNAKRMDSLLIAAVTYLS